jgi:hypothetical protein
MNDPLDDQNDLTMVVSLDVSRGHRMNDPLDDQNLGVSRVNRNCALPDQMTDGKTGVNHDLRMSDPLVYRKTDASRANRNCVRHDRKMDANLDVKNLHVMLMVYLSKSCDQMSHDHLRCAHQMMRHRDTNRMDVKNLDVSWR